MHIVSLPATPKMIGYADHSSPMVASRSRGRSPSRPSSSALERRITSASDKRGVASLQLTPLWEHVVRTQSLPEDTDLHHMFLELSERLKDLEWEVRQHALRVLIDVIPVMDDSLDHRMSTLLGDLVCNLGHQAPAVRKGALDTLRVYLAHSANSEEVLQTIVYEGLENLPDQQLQGNVTVGLILSLPSLIFPQQATDGVAEYPSLKYIVRVLVHKLVQVTFQEVSLRTLVKIRGMIGEELFDQYLNEIQPFDRNDFDLLCQVYNVQDTDVPDPRINFNLTDISASKKILLQSDSVESKNWSDAESVEANSEDLSKAVVPFSPPKSAENEHDDEISEGKVILTTEIKLNSSTAITMTILEEKENHNTDATDSEEELNNHGGVMKVLTDSELEDDFDYRRRTPRRVRFGGEIVKLRTPDSDTAADPSDEEEEEDSTVNDDIDEENVIEITLSTDSNHDIIQKSHMGHRSHIPIPVSPATRVPRVRFDIRPRQYASAPASPVRSRPKLRKQLIYQSHPDLTKKYFCTITDSSQKLKQTRTVQLSLPKVPKRKLRRADDALSPIPVHEEVEVLHNLQNISTRAKQDESLEDNTNSNTVQEEKGVVEDNSDDFTTGPREVEKLTNDFKTYDEARRELEKNGSFDDGESLTSSSGSDYLCLEKSWEDLDLIDYGTVLDLRNKEDWRYRVRGREALLGALRSREVLAGIESRAASFFHLLLAPDRHPRVLTATQDILYFVIDSFSADTLRARLPQLAAGLARMGGPSSIRLTTQLMKKLTPAIVAEQLVNNHILSSRSTKVKENAMQIVMYTALKFPSTEFNVASLASRVGIAATDRKRRIRQAALETLAVLSQIGSMDLVLDAVASGLNNVAFEDKEGVMVAVKARLARRQLPMAGDDYIMTYAHPGESHGADQEWIAAGRGSMSPSSGRSRSSAVYRGTYSVNDPFMRRYGSADPNSNPWNDRRHPEPVHWALMPLNDKEEIQPSRITTAQVWALDQPIQGATRLSLSSGSLRPLYILQTELPDRDGFPPLHRYERDFEETAQHHSHPRSPYHHVQTANSVSSGSSGSPGHESRQPRELRRDYTSGIPVPLARAGSRRFLDLQRNNGPGTPPSRSKIPSTPPVSYERNSGVTPKTLLTRQTFSSADASAFYNTPPAESYLPPIETNGKRKSLSSALSTSQRASPLIESPKTPSTRPQSVEQFEEPDDSEPGEDITPVNSPQKSVSYPESPAKSIESEPKNSESDFDIRSEVSQPQADESVIPDEPVVENDELNFVDDRLSRTTVFDDIEINEITIRKNLKSAPAHTSLDEIDHIDLDSRIAQATNLSAVKSLPGSIINLNNEVNLSAPVKKISLAKRYKVNNPKTPNGKPLKSGRSTRISTTQVGPVADVIRPFERPKEALNNTLHQIDNAEWETTMTGLQGLVRLVRHHPEIVEAQMHSVAVSLARQIRNLRSQVARSACNVAAEMFAVHKRGMEMEMEEVAVPLLHRTADTNRFLRADANVALDSMATNMAPTRVITVLTTRGTTHQNAVVRCAAARLLNNIVQKLGTERIFMLPRDTRDRILTTGANLLLEGSLETRNHTKDMFRVLMNHYNFQRTMMEVVPAGTMRNIGKTLKSIK